MHSQNQWHSIACCLMFFFVGFSSANETVVSDGLDPNIQRAFGEPTLSPKGPVFTYPEADTVFPSGLMPISIHWEPNGNLFFKLTVTGGTSTLTVFTDKSTYRLTQDQWNTLTENSDVQLRLAGKSSADPNDPTFGSESRSISIAKAHFPGAIYYREIQTFKINRIDSGAAHATPLFSTPISEPLCHGCHSISPDGTQLSYSLWNNFDPRSGVVYTSQPNAMTLRSKSPIRWSFTTFHPDGEHLVAVTDGQFWLGKTLPNQPKGVIKIADIPGVCSDGWRAMAPKWSPDGKTLAYVTRPENQKDWNFNRGDLMVVAYDPKTQVVGEPRLLLARGARRNEQTWAFPDWSPDGKWIAVDQGVNMARFRNFSSLWLVDVQTGDAIKLARGASDGHCGYPRFYPSQEGGYYWLLFHSKRPYSNVKDKKQLWGMAIDTSITQGKDPSHPAFWIPGQNLDYDNIQGVVTRHNPESHQAKN